MQQQVGVPDNLTIQGTEECGVRGQLPRAPNHRREEAFAKKAAECIDKQKPTDTVKASVTPHQHG